MKHVRSRYVVRERFVIQLTHVTVRYGRTAPLNDVSLLFRSGTTAVMGPSGSGKSTLLRVIAGMQRPSDGSVEIDGSPVVVASWRSASDDRVSLIHQDYRLVPFLTIEENLLLAAELRGRRPTSAEVDDALDQVGLALTMRHRRPASMSGGEQQRAAIARTLVAGTKVILADEPTGALDADNTHLVAEILVGLGQRDGRTVIVATHDPAVADRMDRRLVIAGGQLAPGEPARA